MIQLQGIIKKYRTDRIETLALEDIDLHVKRGEFLSVMGPSGCGKSTLLNILGLLDIPDGGTMTINEKEVLAQTANQHARFRNQHIGFIFQSFHLVPDLTVVDNVEIPLLYRKVANKERRQRALHALEQVGLTPRTNHYPTQLSGGQQQRVAIARAIVGEPDIILADEPTGNLDSQMGDEIMDILTTLNKQKATSIVMVTHDQLKADQTNRIVRMFDGRVVD